MYSYFISQKDPFNPHVKTYNILLQHISHKVWFPPVFLTSHPDLHVYFQYPGNGRWGRSPLPGREPVPAQTHKAHVSPHVQFPERPYVPLHSPRLSNTVTYCNYILDIATIESVPTANQWVWNYKISLLNINELKDGRLFSCMSWNFIGFLKSVIKFKITILTLGGTSLTVNFNEM